MVQGESRRAERHYVEATPLPEPPSSPRDGSTFPAFSRYRHRFRDFVERFFNKLKRCGAVATRYEKDANYLALIKLAATRIGYLHRRAVYRGSRYHRGRMVALQR